MGDKAAIDATGLLPIPHSHRWDILADGLDPIIESMEGFDKALFARVKSLKWLHHSSHSLGGLFADVWNKTIRLDTGRVQRHEAVRVWFQQHDLAAVASEVDERRRNLIESFQTWQEQARPTVEWNENTISVLKQVPNSGGIEWPESEPPELIDYLGEDHSDSLRNICGKVAELVTYLKMQRGTVARRLAESQQSEKTIPPGDEGNGSPPVIVPRAVQYLIGWPEILDRIGQPDEAKDRIAEFNRNYTGPIITRQGAAPKVDAAELVVWWNGLKDRWLEESVSANAVTPELETYQHGRTETVVPEIGGHETKRVKGRNVK